MHVNDNEKIWFQKYRPATIGECIIPRRAREMLQKYVNDKFVPNILFSGPAGIGKTTVAYALMNELNSDYIFINASKDRGIDVLRNRITDYASSISFDNNRKYVVLDEIDGQTPDAQAAFRSTIESFSSNCGMIATCNFVNKLIDPLQSRFISIDLLPENKEEQREMMVLTVKRCIQILQHENVKFDVEVLKELVKGLYPDMRRVVNSLQKYSTNGNIDTGILSILSDKRVDSLIQFVKGKKFKEMRNWVAENSDIELSFLINALENKMFSSLNSNSIPAMILLMNEYDYKNSFVSNKELNMAAMLTNMMAEAQWK